ALELPLRTLELVAEPSGARDVVEHDAHPEQLAARRLQGRELGVELMFRSVDPELDVALEERPALADRLVDPGPELERPVRDLEILQRAADVRRRKVEESARLRVGEREAPFRV